MKKKVITSLKKKVQKAKSNSRVAKKPARAVVLHKRKQVAKPAARGHWVSESEISRLRETLLEAQETLDAIRSGEVDAVVVSGSKGNQIYSLTSAEQPYRIYVERMQEGAVTVSADSLILYCNQKFADMVKMPLERVIGSQLSMYLGTDSWDKISGIFDGTEEVSKHECALQLANGKTVPTNLTANRLIQDEQKIICLVVTDLTEQKKNEELRLAKEVAEKASLAKDDFLAALSHELRTPLTPVLMMAIALEQNTALPQEARDSLSIIKRNVELEARLIDDLLDLTRIAKGKLELHVSNLDLHTVVQHAMDICRSELNVKSHTITLDLGAKNSRVEGDSVRIQQAIWNLVSNAAKFTGPKGIIKVRTRNPTPETILLEVEDTGIGFEGNIDKLFRAFEQGGRQITRQFGGLGLGLAITRSIIDAHNGKIHATSKGAGKGATFGFEIPITIGVALPETKSSPISKPQNNSQKRILLVEDHKDTRTSLEFLLRKVKYEVKSASNAKEALKLASENEFDLVISDIGLPDQSGLELMQQLKKQFNLTGIGLSGYGMEEDIAKSREAGFVRHLTKPIRIADLKQVISEIGL